MIKRLVHSADCCNCAYVCNSTMHFVSFIEHENPYILFNKQKCKNCFLFLRDISVKTRDVFLCCATIVFVLFVVLLSLFSFNGELRRNLHRGYPQPGLAEREQSSTRTFDFDVTWDTHLEDP